MTHEDKGHFAEKHSPDRKVKPEIAEAVKQRASNGEISCAEAFKIADDFKVPPSEVGFTADFLEIPLVKCQLGLFGYGPKKKYVKPSETVSMAMEGAIRGALKDGRLPCKAAWDIAEKMGTGKMKISSACDSLEIKISSCQLGAF